MTFTTAVHRDRICRSTFKRLARPLALLASMALHVSGVLAGARALSAGHATRASNPAAIEIEVQIAPEPVLAEELSTTPEKPISAPQLESVPRAHAGATHRHSYPVPPGHDARPHDPSIMHSLERDHAPLPNAPALPAVVAASDAPLRFVLPASDGLTTRGSGVTGTVGATGSVVTGPAEQSGEPGAPTWPAAAVDSQARLLASVPVVYPEDARRAEIEADVLVEIVVDRDGHVADARSMTAHRHELEEAALRAVRRYRFAPAQRGGHPVRVRMKWTIAFRLR